MKGSLLGADSALVVRGQHTADPIAKCAQCHGPGLAGRVFIDDPAFGRFIAPNLTRGAGGLGARLFAPSKRLWRP